MKLLEIGKLYSGFFACELIEDLLRIEVVVCFDVEQTDDPEKF